MQFFLLGDVRARQDERHLQLNSKPRALLAVLLFWPNAIVRRTEIVRLIWGNPADAPPTAADLVPDYVSRLRTAFRKLGVPEGEVALIARQPGYLLKVDAETVDWHQFRRLAASARRARDAADMETATRLFQRALGLWQGPPLADLSPSLDPIRQEMENHLLAAAEDLAEIEISRGRADRIVQLLIELTQRHPARERLLALLIQALHATGRRDEAVTAYQRSRTFLTTALGLDPVAAVEHAYQALLNGDPPDRSSRPAGPAQLPLDTANFVGRGTELAALLALVPRPGAAEARRAMADTAAAGGAGVICVVDGMAGVGKTALAVHAAHRLKQWFPDGQLFLDLHGHTADTPRVEPAEALGRLLGSLGVAGESLPQHLDDRAAVYRDRLANRRMMILLDNADSADQVRPLLPAAAGCLVMVTSRRRLAALDDARPLSLETLPATDAVQLFNRIAGADRVSGQHADVERITELCAGLPLAIRIAAARLRNHPAWQPRYLADRLSDALSPPWELDDGERSIATAFTLSFRGLTETQRRMFRLLGLVPGPDIDVYAAAALIDVPAGTAERILHDMLAAHLLNQQVEDRYLFHDLMRYFAANLANSEDSTVDRRAALGRLLDHRLHTAATAMDVLFPHERGRRPVVATPLTAAPDVSTRRAARAWLDAERTNLIATAAFAAEHGWPEYTQAVNTTIYRYLVTGAHYAEALALNQQALRVVQNRDEPAGVGVVLSQLGDTYWRLGRYDEALDHLQRALAAHQAAGDRAEEAVTLTNLGVALSLAGRSTDALEHLHRALALGRAVGNPASNANTLANLGNVAMFGGDFGAAFEHYREALQIFAEIGNRQGESTTLANLGNLYLRTGAYDKAIEHYERARQISVELGDRAGEGTALTNLGETHGQRGRYDLAVAYLRRALNIFRAIGHRPYQSETLGLLAACYAGLQRYDEAIAQLRQALRLAQEIGDRTLEAKIANGLGATLRSAGQAEPAMAAHRSALELAGRLGNRYEQARALEGIADLLDLAGDGAAARRHWREALDIYTDLGVAEAQRIRLRPPAD